MNIVLCGFMGCGKTTVGRRAAKRLGLEFVDMDSYIEQKAGMRVSEIFAKHGEAEFRKMESEAARELSEKSGLLIATGGGAVLNPDNAAAFHSGGIVVLLQVTPETVIRRLKNSTNRPLLQRPDREQAVRELMEQRSAAYQAAASIVLYADGPIAFTTHLLIQSVKNYLDKGTHKGL